MTKYKPLYEIEGVTLEGNRQELEIVLRLLRESIPIAEELLREGTRVSPLSPVSSAALTAFQTVSSLVASAGTKCNLMSPAEDIETKVDNNGDIIYRCLHHPPHRWNLSGKRLEP